MFVNATRLWFSAGLLAVAVMVGGVAHSRAQLPQDDPSPGDESGFSSSDDFAFQFGAPDGRDPDGPRPDGPRPDGRPGGGAGFDGPRPDGPRGDGRRADEPGPDGRRGDGPPGFGRGVPGGPPGGPPEMLLRRLDELNHKLDMVLHELNELKRERSGGPRPPQIPPGAGGFRRPDGGDRQGPQRGIGPPGRERGDGSRRPDGRPGDAERRPQRPESDGDRPRRESDGPRRGPGNGEDNPGEIENETSSAPETA